MKSDDLKRRTFQFAIRCVRLVEALPPTATGQILGKQLLRCATSVGANYRAAARSRSLLDFISKMGIVEEECDETLYWIEVLNELGAVPAERTKSLYSEGAEILSIIVTSIKTAKSNRKGNKSQPNRRPTAEMGHVPRVSVFHSAIRIPNSAMACTICRVH